MRSLENTRTLCLNSDYTPYKIYPWQRAVTLIYCKKKCLEVDFYSDLKIKDGHSRYYPVPAVIAYKKYIKKSTKLKCSRKNILLRDEMTCQYCARRFAGNELNLDHVIPKSRWNREESPTNFLNIVASCYRCNRQKRNRLCEEVGMYPIRPPYVPNKFELALGINPWATTIPQEWKIYLEHYPFFKELQYV